MAYIGAAEQNIMTWLLKIEKREDIPSFFLESFNEYFPESFPYTVYCPGQSKSDCEKEAKLLCFDGTNVFVFSRSKPVFRENIDNLSLVSFRQFLLEAHLILASENGSTSEIEFNPVCKQLLLKVVKTARHLGNASDLDPELEALRLSDYKAFGIASRQLAGAAPLKFWLRQPSVGANRLFVTKNFIAAHMLLLTETEVVWVSEDIKTTDKIGTFGGDSWYIPLRYVESANIEDVSSKTISLCICVSGKQSVDIKFPSSRRAEVEKMKNMILEGSASVERT